MTFIGGCDYTEPQNVSKVVGARSVVGLTDYRQRFDYVFVGARQPSAIQSPSARRRLFVDVV
jgi:hypothetical protein